MKDACTQTANEETASIVPSMAPRIRRHTEIFTFKIWWFYESIHPQQSKFYGNLPFTILMTLQQSVVAERGREPGGFPSERAESILLGKGAKSVVVMPDSIFLGHRYSRPAPPFPFRLPVAITHQSGHGVLKSATCK